MPSPLSSPDAPANQASQAGRDRRPAVHAAWCGPWDRSEFAWATASLNGADCQPDAWQRFSNVEALIAHLEAG
ncbi:MAG: hypothetical protein KDA61_21450, partial [Planctomycetales bacterium]|nr:hypothetical protein [Planctomycetales bacterium]